MPDHRADANVADETLRTLLHLAAAGIPELSSPEIITLLLDAGAAINAADKAGDTPLHLAAAHVRTQITETVKLLLARGADNYVSDTACKVAMGDDPSERAFFTRNGPPGGARTPRRGRGGRNHKVPNHISKTVLSTVHLGPPKEIRATLIRVMMPRGRPRLLVKRNSTPHVVVSSDYEVTAQEHLSISCILCAAHV